MGLFDDSPYSTPPQVAPVDNSVPNQADFTARLIAAARAQGRANPGSLLNLLTGRQTDADVTKAQSLAPGLYQALLASQSATRNAQLGTASGIAGTSAMTGQQINPDNIDASIPGLMKAYGMVFNGDQQPNANAAPTSAPANANPIAQMDALFGGKPVNPDIVMQRESGGDPSAVSPKGATGEMQVMPQTGMQPGFGVAPMNGPSDNKRFGADYLTAMQARYKSPTLGLIAYNMGPGATDRWLKAGGDINQLPQETRQYVGDILKLHGQAGLLTAPQQAQQQQPADPEAPMRAMYMRMAKLKMMMGDAQGSKAYFDMANLGRPEGTVPTNDGQFKEPTVQTPNGPMPAQQFGAQGKTADAAGEAFGKNTQTPVNVVTRNGNSVMSQADVMKAGGAQMGADGKPMWLTADSPQYKVIQASQQKEIGDWRSDAQAAATGLDTAQQLYNAANGLFTGKGGETAQDIRKILQTLGTTFGVKVPDKIINSTSKFEQLKYAALNFVQSASHQFSPRAAQMIVRMVQQAKPGEATSPQGLKDIIAKEVIPAFMRAQGLYQATEDYYQQNPLATDASTKVPNQVPLSKFSVKHYPDTVAPGDFYVSRHDGSLKQRPVQ